MTTGRYRTYSCTNAPTPYGETLVYNNGGDVRQIFLSAYGEAGSAPETPSTYMRNFVNNTWTDWVRLYDTSLLNNSTMLGQLASALGVDGIQFGYQKSSIWPSNYTGQVHLHTADNTASVELDIKCENGYNQPDPEVKVRSKYNNNTGDWHNILLDVPSFYKDYNNLSALANALGGQGLIPQRAIQIQPNESVQLGSQCACVLVHADMLYFNGNKMVSADTNGVHTVFDYSSQGGFDNRLRFFGNNEVWVENISSDTLNIKFISFFEE